MPTRSLIALCLGLAFVQSVAAQTVQTAPPKPIPVSELVKNPKDYFGQRVTVEGWYWSRTEARMLQGHGGSIEPDPKKIVWVEDINYILAKEKTLRKGLKLRCTKPTPLSPEEKKAYRKFMMNTQYDPVPVVLQGEFQTFDQPAFGFQKSFRHRLILYKVLAIKARK